MQEGLRQLLIYDDLRREITDPKILAEVINVFTQSDREKIAAETRERGASYGVLELLNRLTKRGPKAFPQFLDGLEQMEHKETAKDLREKARAQNLLPAKPINPAHADGIITKNVHELPVARGPKRTEAASFFVSSIPYSNEESNLANNSIPAPHFLSDSGSDNTSELDADTFSASNNLHVDKRNRGSNQGPETLLRDMPLKLKSRIVSAMNNDCALGNNWKGLAGEAGFTVEDEEKLRSSSDGPMEGLFQWMVQKQLHVSHLIDMLRKQGRDDVISIIGEYGYAEQPGMEKTNLLEQANLPSAFQESESDFKESEEKKHLEHKLSQEASENKDEQEELSTYPPGDIPEDNVFLPENINGKALFISIETYRNMTCLSKLNYQVNQLSGVMEYHGWEVRKSGKDCMSTRMKSIIDNYLGTIENSDVCLVYLAGHTLQINGENYLLPTEADINSSTADIIECSLNINNFVKELTKRQALMILLFVDGAHSCEGESSNPAALTGLAPMLPPSNTVIAFPCKPGCIRPESERLSFAVAVKKILEDQENPTPVTLFSALKQEHPSSMVFSLSPRSLVPLYIYTSHEGMKSHFSTILSRNLSANFQIAHRRKKINFLNLKRAGFIQ
ncbi:hypothetical protein QZH41_013789 [Actinostola sp. cb2023]|nr:hypothetical protein QZH41_013789 [Actinostola sp. cb2023]